MDENYFSALENPELAPDPDTGSGRGVAILDLLVSLFLILLCFFLVMDSISNQQLVRAHDAVKSIKTAFRKMPRKKPELLELVARGKLGTASEQYYNEIHGMLSEMVDFPGKFPDREMVPVRVEVPPDTLFVRGGSRVRFDQAPFLDDLAGALKTAPAGEERSVEILIGSGSALPSDQKNWRNLYVKRAANFAKELEKRGVPSGLVSAGVVAVDSEAIWITFLARRRGLDMGAGAVTLPGSDGGRE